MPGRSYRAEIGMALVPIGLALVTLVVLLDPRVAPAVVNPRLALAIDVTASLVALAVAILAWVHFREGRDRADLLRGSAFLVLGINNALFVVVTVLGLEPAFGLTRDDPGQLPLWATSMSRSVAVLLLVAAGWAALRPPARAPSRPRLVFWAPAAMVLGLTLLAVLARVELPVIAQPDALMDIHRDPRNPLDAGRAAPLIAWQIAIAIGFLAAAALSYRVYRRTGQMNEAVLSIGFVIPAFSQVLFSIHPGTYEGLVTGGDVLRVAFYMVLLFQLAVERQGEVRGLRQAHGELVRLREADVERATSEERARLAREIHDGMSQELWYARLKQGRLADMDDLSAPAKQLADEVADALESALSEARQAILALRPAEGGTFAQVLERYVQDFADRFGIAAESSTDPGAERLSTRAQAELLRIVQEALNNARRHADPTRVRVRVEATPAGLRLVVADNGRGFDAQAGAGNGYGLRSMRERAGIIGARLRVESAPSDGTQVIVDVPLEGSTP